MRLIDADALAVLLANEIEKVPTIEPKIGKWVLSCDDSYLFHRCSTCSTKALYMYGKEILTDFCPFCGSDNREDNEKGETK